jgi:aminoglycoside phosphotransferase (APT) family kinase protein
MLTKQDLERALAEDLAWVASELRSEISEVTAVSPLRGRDRPRAAFRVRLADGRQLKLRRMRSPERAAQVARLTGSLRDLGVPQVVLLRAGALAVEWVEGTPLREGPGHPDRIEEAGRLLGRIHATPAFEGLSLPVLRPTAPDLLGMREELATLVREGRLEADTGERLMAAAHERDPGSALHGIVHGDFCAENLVIDGDSRLRVVDNEGLEIGPLARDLARAGSRWPMPAAAWERFVAAYRSAGGIHAADEVLEFWRIPIQVRSAHFRVSHRLAGDAEALARVQSLLERL